MGREEVSSGHGAWYFDSKTGQIHQSSVLDQYHYRAHIGPHHFDLEAGDSAFVIAARQDMAHLHRGPKKIDSSDFAVVIRGYAPDERSVHFSRSTVLPYVNGCSTKQIFAPERPGDPTLQMLFMPPNSNEQFHHIHSTARVVYVLEGRGTSIVGMNKETVREELRPGMVCILDKMCPHHFETGSEALIVLPLHVWSTVSGAEVAHPMYNGTFRTD